MTPRARRRTQCPLHHALLEPLGLLNWRGLTFPSRAALHPRLAPPGANRALALVTALALGGLASLDAQPRAGGLGVGTAQRDFCSACGDDRIPALMLCRIARAPAFATLLPQDRVRSHRGVYGRRTTGHCPRAPASRERQPYGNGAAVALLLCGLLCTLNLFFGRTRAVDGARLTRTACGAPEEYSATNARHCSVRQGGAPVVQIHYAAARLASRSRLDALGELFSSSGCRGRNSYFGCCQDRATLEGYNAVIVCDT